LQISSGTQFVSGTTAVDDAASSNLRESQAQGMRSGQVVALANLPIAALAALVIHERIDPSLLIGWFCLFAIVLAARFATTEWQARRAVAVERQLITHTMGTLASGLLWGILPVMLIGRGSFIEFGFCGFVIAGVTAGALPALCWYRPAYLGYLFGATLPLAAALFLHGGDTYAAMGGLALFYAIVLFLTARRYNRTVMETLQLRYDVTQLGQRLLSTEDELALADFEKWRTISHLSHELRTPLNAVLGFSEMLERESLGPVGNDAYRGYAHIIRESGTAILRLVEELLEYSAAETGSLVINRTPTDCRRLLDECLAGCQDAAAQAGINVVQNMPDETIVAWAADSKLKLAIENILDNAIRYTPENGQITVSLKGGDTDQVTIVIADTGVGMSRQDIEVALAPFGRLASPLTNQNPGTGLGLPLARLLVELHEGRLDIVSKPSVGTTVTICLPRVEQQAAANRVVPLRSA
jgi:signal transduction histidine kinase